MKNKKNKYIKLLLSLNVGIILIMTVVGIKVYNSFNSYKCNIKELQTENNVLKSNINSLTEINEQMRKYKNIYDKFAVIDTHDATRYYENIPLTFEEQEFVQKLAEENGFTETFIYGLMQGESNFRKDVISYNQTSYGIMQINKNYSDFYAQLAGLEGYDIMDFYDNVRMGVATLKYLREYWTEEGITDKETLIHYILSAYNLGNGGLYKKIKETGTSITNYSKIVIEYKNNIEIEGKK